MALSDSSPAKLSAFQLGQEPRNISGLHPARHSSLAVPSYPHAWHYTQIRKQDIDELGRFPKTKEFCRCQSGAWEK